MTDKPKSRHAPTEEDLLRGIFGPVGPKNKKKSQPKSRKNAVSGTQGSAQNVSVQNVCHLTDREVATILAALRYWQRALVGTSGTPPIMDHFQQHESLSSEEIDDLCENLNFS